MNKKTIAPAIVTLAILGAAFALTPQPEPVYTGPLVNDTGWTEDGVNAVVLANNQFAFNFYSKINKQDENLFFSPYSISMALAMTYEGARGKTAEEMQKVFGFPTNKSLRRAAYAKIFNEINKGSIKYELKTANALWAHKDYVFLEDFLNTVEQYYGGKVTNLDFSDMENSRRIINNWVEEQTNNKIKNLISIKDLISKGVNNLTYLVLTNAIYFKGKWAQQFDKAKTEKANFEIGPHRIEKVDMMKMKNAEFNYTETEELQILEMPYVGNKISMLILLPKKGYGLLDINFTAEELAKWKNKLHKQELNVFIPKFKFETKYFIAEILSDMGMSRAFSMDDADFSGIDETQMLFLQKIIHQAFVEVNEEGTEAATSTGVFLVPGATIPKDFRADHPFIFIIQQKETGNILFFGKVVNPAKNTK